MNFTNLQLTNFRSYSNASFTLGENITLVVGPNASGKTNLLESVYVLVAGKSFRAKEIDLINHGQSYFRVELKSPEDSYSLGFKHEEGRQEKRVSHGKAKKSLAQHLGTLQAVLFEPGDLNLISGPPDRRRRYLDYILCLTDKQYLKALQQYRKVLRQRNALLAKSRTFNPGLSATSELQNQIFAWDIQLTDLAVDIFNKRQALVQHINRLADGLYTEIAGEPVGLKMNYSASVPAEDYADNFMRTLQSNLTRDLAAGFTTIGPHREDFAVSFGSGNLTAVASRGETRTAVLVLKLAEMDYVEGVTGVNPLLLLDDVFSELDNSRRQFLLQKLGGRQTIITTTEADTLKGEVKDYHLIETAPKSRVTSRGSRATQDSGHKTQDTPDGGGA